MDYEFTLALANWTLQLVTLGTPIMIFFYTKLMPLNPVGMLVFIFVAVRLCQAIVKLPSDIVFSDTLVDTFNSAAGSVICRNSQVLHCT